jgi:DNA damage-binding protein 1
MEEIQIQDMEFLHGCPLPTIILIHQDHNGRHIKTHEISLKDKEFVKVNIHLSPCNKILKINAHCNCLQTPWKQDNIDAEACLIIPVPEPFNGAIVVGQETILYHDGVNYVAVTPPAIKVLLFGLVSNISYNSLIF